MWLSIFNCTGSIINMNILIMSIFFFCTAQKLRNAVNHITNIYPDLFELHSILIAPPLVTGEFLSSLAGIYYNAVLFDPYLWGEGAILQSMSTCFGSLDIRMSTYELFSHLASNSLKIICMSNVLGQPTSGLSYEWYVSFG